MKKIAVLLILILITTFECFAQSYQDMVYLNDGHILKGVILEIVPDDYLKIETNNGKIYTIDMNEVVKISKEKPRANTQNYNRETQRYNRETQQNNRESQVVNRRVYSSSGKQNNNQYSYSNVRTSNAQRQNYDEDDDYYDDYRDYSYFPNRGYKGFIDLVYSYGTSSKVGTYDLPGENRFEISTSHGFFFSPYMFVGLGVGLHVYTGYNEDNNYYSYEKETIEIPIFAHIRSHFIDAKVSPFVDIKLGYSVYDITGTYFSPSLGCRFAKGSRSAFWISLGYTVQYIDKSYFNTSANSQAFSMKVGWDF